MRFRIRILKCNLFSDRILPCKVPLRQNVIHDSHARVSERICLRKKPAPQQRNLQRAKEIVAGGVQRSTWAGFRIRIGASRDAECK
jgi:hypothetical protein